jgi:GAF domain-containing protein
MRIDVASRADTRARADRLLAEEQAALRRVATLVAAGATAEELFAAVVDEAAAVLDVTTVMLGRYDEANSTLTVLAALNELTLARGTRWPLDGPSVAASVLATGRSARIDDYAGLHGSIAAGVRDSSITSVVGAPISVDGAVWGVMVVGARGGDILPPDSDTRLADFAELVATAISNAESRERLEFLLSEQAALRRVATLVAQAARPTDIFGAVAGEVARVLDLPGVEVVRYTADGRGTIVATSGYHRFPTGSSWPLEEGTIMDMVRATGSPARLESYDDLSGSIAEASRRAGFRSAIGAPIVVDGATWGVIVAMSSLPDRIPDGAEVKLGLFTDLVATAVSNLQAHDDLRGLADRQAALRRVVTLVARESSPDEVFGAVTEEAARVLRLAAVALLRFDSDLTATLVAQSRTPWDPPPLGTHLPLEGENVVALVLRTGQAARVDDWAKSTGPLAGIAESLGVRSTVACPIVVGGRLWGTLIAATSRSEPLPADTESRLGEFTEVVATAIANTEARAELSRLANEQAALRRVATLVAEGSSPTEVFDAVCEETGRLGEATSVNLSHYTPDGVNVTMAGWSLRDTHVPVGTRFPITPDTIAGEIVRTHVAARIDSWEGRTSELAKLVRARGIRSSVGAPVVVDGQLWGALVAATDREAPLPAGTEIRLARFTDLIATAVANATTRSDLIASRARIVSAGDEARRRIERNLHDGTQQRLIALGLDLQRIRPTIPVEHDEAHEGLERAGRDLESVLEDLRELSRGLHPPLLSRRGLRPALRAVARRSPIPVELDIDLPERPRPPLETAVYYVVSEAVTNAIKHSHASSISVTISTDHAGGPFGVGLDGRGRIVNLHATIVDDGVGGAVPSEGSGLMGLFDRVDALGGRAALDTPAGGGTRISIELPLESPSPPP